MIAFNHNIYFTDQPSLEDNHYNSSKNDFFIVQSSSLDAFNELDIKSPYQSMSGREVGYGTQKKYALCEKGRQWGMDVKGVVFILWRCGEGTIEYIPQKLFTPELLQFWILHTVLPIVFTLEKRYDILHVGAVEVEGKPILFSAESFGGKSTMTDYFIQKGHTMLSDDSLGVCKENGKYMTIASYPFHRPFREAEVLGYPVKNVATEPKPLHAVYLLEKSASTEKVNIIKVKGIEKFKAFHFSSFINFDFLKTHRFKLLSDMSKYIPVYKVTVPWDMNRLEEVYLSIVHHSRNLT